MIAVLRRLAVPLVGASLVVIIVIVGLVLLDLPGSAGYEASSLPLIQIGDTSSGQGQGSGMGQGQNGSDGSGSMGHSSMTVVTEHVHVMQGHMHQGGSGSGVDGSSSPAEGE